MNEILKYFPNNIKIIMENEINDDFEKLEEIRIRVQKPIILKFSNLEKIIRYKITREEILNILQLVCENSIYSYQKQISEGFITIRGGHRVGISGTCVMENGNVININYINSLNFRIARQVVGCSEELLEYILDIENNTIYNTLIVSPPGCRKNNNFKRFSKTNIKWY